MTSLSLSLSLSLSMEAHEYKRIMKWEALIFHLLKSHVLSVFFSFVFSYRFDHAKFYSIFLTNYYIQTDDSSRFTFSDGLYR